MVGRAGRGVKGADGDSIVLLKPGNDGVTMTKVDAQVFMVYMIYYNG